MGKTNSPSPEEQGNKSELPLVEGQNPDNFSAKEHYEEEFNPENVEVVDMKDMPKVEEDFTDVVVEKEEHDQKTQEIAKASLVRYLNGVNEWKLIAETRNDFLGWRSTTTAMNIPGLGVVLCIREGLDSKLSVTSQLLPGCNIIEFEYTDENGNVETKYKIEELNYAIERGHILKTISKGN